MIPSIFTPPSIDTGGLDATATEAVASRVTGFRSGTGEIRFHIIGDNTVFDVRGLDECAVRVQSIDKGWPADAVVAVQISTNGTDWSDSKTSAITFTASGGAADINVTGISYLRAVVTTKTSDSGYFKANVYFNGTSTTS